MPPNEKPPGNAQPLPNVSHNDAREQRIHIATTLLASWLAGRGALTSNELETLAHAACKAALIIQTNS